MSKTGRDPGKPEEAYNCPNKQLKEEFGVMSSLLVEVVVTTGGPYGEKLGEESDESSELFVSGQFIYMVYYIDRLSYVEPSLHLWDKAYLVMVNNVFEMFLDCYVSNFISDFINLDALSAFWFLCSMWSVLEKVPWGTEKKQKDGSCFCIHSVILCLFIELSPLILRDIIDQFLLEEFSSMILLNMFSVPLSWYSSPSSIPIIQRKVIRIQLYTKLALERIMGSLLLYTQAIPKRKVEYCSFQVCEELCCDFDGDCIEFVDCFCLIALAKTSSTTLNNTKRVYNLVLFLILVESL
ncbi:hypothetical protein STEG23_033768 [Scotinomys teguina]